jgi:hypothetical protein
LKAFSSLNPACRKLFISSFLEVEQSQHDLQCDRKAEDRITAQNLDGPNSHVDLGSSEVGALEAFKVSGSCGFGSLQLSGVNNQSECRFNLGF